MILWLLLFALVVAISFVLAIQSMRDYQEIPTEEEYGLFLVRELHALNASWLDEIKNSLKSGQVIALERLFKGNQSTIVIFVPRNLSVKFNKELDPVEIEDYSRRIGLEQISAWEMKVKWAGEKIFENLPILTEQEQFWWQVTFTASYQPQIKAVVVSGSRKEALVAVLQNLVPAQLIKLPKAFSNESLLDFYQKRSYKKEAKNPTLSAAEILRLVTI